MIDKCKANAYLGRMTTYEKRDENFTFRLPKALKKWLYLRAKTEKSPGEYLIKLLERERAEETKKP